MLDGAYLAGTEPPVFRRIAPPSGAELQTLVERLAERIGRVLERQGVLARDAESSYLELSPETGGVAQYAGFSLHAGVGAEAEQREKLERLARYVSRPPVSEERL